MRQASLESFQLRRSAASPCSFKSGLSARMIYLRAKEPVDRALYGRLIDSGFRRDGHHIYRPDCDHCRACVATRVAVAEFAPRRRHRRIWRANQDLVVVEDNNADDEESFALYRKYISARHRDGVMFPPSYVQFRLFIRAATADTLFAKYYLGKTLVGVAATDLLDRGLSAVYTWFDPGQQRRSLGVWSILWQIRRTRAAGLPWLYLGYWVENSPKMDYKIDFQPIEQLRGGEWVRPKALPMGGDCGTMRRSPAGGKE